MATSPSLAKDKEPVVQIPQPRPENRFESIPANWSLTPLENDEVEAVNCASNRRLTLTIEEFNEFLRR